MKITIPLPVAYSGILFLVISTALTSKLYAQVPANDLCTGAGTLTESGSCINTIGTLKNAGATAGLTGCGNVASADVWYQFTAASSYPIIAISGFGSSFKAAAPVVQLFSGSCAGLSSLACVAGTSGSNSVTLNTGLAVGGTGLVAGNTYYIRVYTNTNTGTPSGTNWGFSICVSVAPDPQVDYGKSYVNITKGVNGGTIEPGDTLEIRATFVVKANTAYHCTFTDNIPLNTTYIPGTLRTLTNEGKIYQQFSDLADGDGGTITGSAVAINFGLGASASAGGILANTSKPSFYNSACITVASYRVVVSTAATYGTKVPVGYGIFTYGTDNFVTVPKTFPPDTIMVYRNFGICANTVGTNAILSESGGTFGSGNIKDRAPSGKVPANYTNAAFSNASGMPGDYYYGISNNTSGGTTTALGYSVLNTYPYPTNPQRIFGVWDIIGDHTGATNPILGNPATDDNAGASGGYMVVINAAYRTDTAFLDTVSNLCPNTYYQYAAWFRNICSKCGCDSTGKGATGGAGYIPTATGDSSGVHPNLTFSINGYDYYTTGDMQYTGKWEHKGFTYLTGPTQTSMVINIRNNAPGGGGNDWAIDDIGVATCSPSIALTPDKPDTLCQGADDTVRFKVSSYFSNYTEWMLEKSVDGGITWTTPGTDTTGAAATGSSVPVYNALSDQYEYLVTRYYRLSTAVLTTYRITIASTVSNLGNINCATANTTHKLVYGVNCMVALPTDIISFTGTLQDVSAALQWTTANETGDITFTVERSDDGIHFVPAGTLAGQSENSPGSTYHYNEGQAAGTVVYYRILMQSRALQKYSRIIVVGNMALSFDLHNVSNPFTDWLSFDLTAPENGSASFMLLDMYGRLIKMERQPVTRGYNNIRIYGLSGIPEGTYTLHVQCAEGVVNKLVIKLPK